MRMTNRAVVLISLIACSTAVLLPSDASGTWTLGWADKFLVGDVYAQIKSPNEGGSLAHFRDSRGWEIVGAQTHSGKANAREQVAYTMVDQTTSKCGLLKIDFLRYRKTVEGFVHSTGSTCPVWTNYTWQKTVSYNSYTCPTNDVQQAVSSYLTLDHSDATYLPGYHAWWQYLTQHYVEWGVPGDAGSATSYGCHSIYWWNF